MIGFGKIASESGKDPLSAAHFRYVSHAQVLRAHSGYEWIAVVDPSEEARARARKEWGIQHTFASAGELSKADLNLDVVVLATPPANRLAELQAVPGIRGALIEKPVAITSAEASALTKYCKDQGIALQVNFWRRGDSWLRSLVGNSLGTKIGDIQTASVVYGNGLLNNGSHMVDMLRMFFGEVESVEAARMHSAIAPLPIQSDAQYSCILNFPGGLRSFLSPIDFAHYRENGADFWGTRGRISIVQEGLRALYSPVKSHRALSSSNEIASDSPEIITTGATDALFQMYENLLTAIRDKGVLWSDGESAFRNSLVLDGIQKSASENGKRISV